MEVEAKFSIPDSTTLHRLQTTTRIAGFPLAKVKTRLIHDTYVDTKERKILAGGYACRFRQAAEGFQVTLKGIGGAVGAIHKREEVQIMLPSIQQPEDWPACPLREQVLQLTRGNPLVLLVELDQTRIFRPVHKQQRTIAELCLDEVNFMAEDKKQVYFELEVELTPPGSEEDLAIIAVYLEKKWSLSPQPLSKFERALTLLDKNSEKPLLSMEVKTALARISERTDWQGSRARALLRLEVVEDGAAGKQAFPIKRLAARSIDRNGRSGAGCLPSKRPVWVFSRPPLWKRVYRWYLRVMRRPLSIPRPRLSALP